MYTYIHPIVECLFCFAIIIVDEILLLVNL